MKTVQEYLLNSKTIGKQTLYLPKNAEVLTVRETSKGLILFVLASSTESTTELRSFRICSTAELFSADKLCYVTTCELRGSLRHIFEIS